MSNDDSGGGDFDFQAHASGAVERYRHARRDYDHLAEIAKRVLIETLDAAGIRIHSIEARAKTLESFAKKAALPSEANARRPKYPDPVTEITDLAGVRIITFLPRTVEEVCRHIEQEFTVLERTDKSAELLDEGRIGYQSIHFLAQMHPNRIRLAEYRRHRGLTFEIQVRTLLQHAWAEMEHDIQYKSSTVIPASIRRKFIALAGLLEIADREFQSLQDEDEALRQQARQSVRIGNLSKVEITPDALKSYLDKKFGSDGRMSQWSYEFTANTLRRLGFETLSQVDECIAGYDDDKVSRAAWGSRVGQLSRFEDTVLASMGEQFVDLHPGAREYPDWRERLRARLEKIRQAGIRTGSYFPGATRQNFPPETTAASEATKDEA
jgi:ppGpp synthetase/RelA/SpoT-type nucleotidyltranferase